MSIKSDMAAFETFAALHNMGCRDLMMVDVNYHKAACYTCQTLYNLVTRKIEPWSNALPRHLVAAPA